MIKLEKNRFLRYEIRNMHTRKFFQFLLILGTALFMLGTLLFFKQGELPLIGAHHADLVAQNTNTYLGPTQRLPGNPQMIRVQILLYDDPSPKGVQLISAEFDGTSIPLKPRDIYGYRGQASFQKPPGKYKLKWEVRQDEQAWPRTIDHEEEVFLDPRDFWIQISITGNSASIS